MSRHIAVLGDSPLDDVGVHSFAGGVEKGQCIQLNQRRQGVGEDQFHNVRLNKAQALKLAHTLIDWAAGEDVAL